MKDIKLRVQAGGRLKGKSWRLLVGGVKTSGVWGRRKVGQVKTSGVWGRGGGAGRGERE